MFPAATPVESNEEWGDSDVLGSRDSVIQVDAANARKAQKEMGEVTSDHTFKPKLRNPGILNGLGRFHSWPSINFSGRFFFSHAIEKNMTYGKS